MSVRVTLSTGSLYGYPLDHALALAARLGLDGIEVFLTDRLLAAGPTPLLARSDRHGLSIVSVHCPILGRDTETELEAGYVQAADFARNLPACETVVVHTTEAISLHDRRGQRYLETLCRAQDRVRQGRTRLAIENRGVARVPVRPAFLDDLHHLRRLAEEWDFGLTYDVAHAASWGLETGLAYEALGPRVSNIHLSNCRASGWPGTLPGLTSHLRDHQPLDTGILAIDSLLGRLAGGQYRGLLTLELSPLALHLPQPWRAFERLADSVARCRAGLAGAEEQGGRGAEEQRSRGAGEQRN